MKMKNMMMAPHSGDGMKHADHKMRGERPTKVMPTSMNMQPPTETNLPMLGGADKIPMRQEMLTKPNHFMPVDHSGPKHKHPPVKSWKRKGYSTDLPTSGESRNGGSSLS